MANKQSALKQLVADLRSEMHDKMSDLQRQLDDLSQRLENERQRMPLTAEVAQSKESSSKRKVKKEESIGVEYSMDDEEFFTSQEFDDLFGSTHTLDITQVLTKGQRKKTCGYSVCRVETYSFCKECSAGATEKKDLVMFCPKNRHREQHWLDVHKPQAEESGAAVTKQKRPRKARSDEQQTIIIDQGSRSSRSSSSKKKK